MLDTGVIIKDFLLADTLITDLVGQNIYNLVVFTSTDQQIKPPYLVVELLQVAPNKTKDIYTYANISAAINVLSPTYDSLLEVSRTVIDSIDNKDIMDVMIQFSNYSESFDSAFELYHAQITFDCKKL